MQRCTIITLNFLCVLYSFANLEILHLCIFFVMKKVYLSRQGKRTYFHSYLDLQLLHLQTQTMQPCISTLVPDSTNASFLSFKKKSVIFMDSHFFYLEKSYLINSSTCHPNPFHHIPTSAYKAFPDSPVYAFLVSGTQIRPQVNVASYLPLSFLQKRQHTLYSTPNFLFPLSMYWKSFCNSTRSSISIFFF